jgi:hypothetical protein
MTKGICMPGMLGCDAKVLFEKGMTSHHVHNDFLVGGTSLIIGHPSSINELKLTILD